MRLPIRGNTNSPRDPPMRKMPMCQGKGVSKSKQRRLYLIRSKEQCDMRVTSSGTPPHVARHLRMEQQRQAQPYQASKMSGVGLAESPARKEGGSGQVSPRGCIASRTTPSAVPMQSSPYGYLQGNILTCSWRLFRSTERRRLRRTTGPQRSRDTSVRDL